MIRSGFSIFLTTLFAISGVCFSAVGAEVEIQISQENCRRLIAHHAAADVDYKAGVDAYGRSVVPADISSRRSLKIDHIIIDMSLPLQDLLDNPPAGLENVDVIIGKIEYDISSGKMLFNGQPVATEATDALIYECRRNFK